VWGVRKALTGRETQHRHKLNHQFFLHWGTPSVKLWVNSPEESGATAFYGLPASHWPVIVRPLA
jgi:hypothetical protein|tara:strand:- start:831 stop:1022 length:192 start_codon:yes stop_codon:yes gene_type:complete